MARLLLTLLLLVPVLPVRAVEVAGMFGEGHSQFSLEAGNAYAFDSSYFVFGGSASHYVSDGVGVGLSLEKWSGNGPGITKYSPFVQYVFYRAPVTKPYAGAYYRHTVIAGMAGLNSLGVRAGVLITTLSNAYVSFGIAHESYLDCQVSIYRACSETHPDIALVFSF